MIVENSFSRVRPTLALSAKDEKKPVPAELLHLGYNEAIFRVRAADSGFLVVNEQFHPSWRAWVDGEPQPVFRANFRFRAVPLEAGLHDVRLRYTPAWLPVALTFYVVGFVVALLGIIGRPRIRGRGA